MSMVGFDFGTTNSLISTIDRDGVATHYLDERDRPIPSAAGYEGTRKVLGREAKERLAEAGLGIHGKFLRSPKKHLGEESITIDGVQRDPVEIVADVVRHVCELATSSGGRTLDKVTSAVVTIPVDMEGYKRRALREAFAQAGVRIAQFVHEPFAALYGYFRSADLSADLDRFDGKLALVFDWGGGTLDLTLCRIVGDTVVQVMNDGSDEVGGDVFDETIMRHILTKVAHAKGLSDEIDIQPGAKERLLDDCERAKIALSGRSSTSVYVGNFFRNTDSDDVEYTLSKDELEEAVGTLLDKGFARIDKVLSDAGYGHKPGGPVPGDRRHVQHAHSEREAAPVVRTAAGEGTRQDRDAHRRRGRADCHRQRLAAPREERGTRARKRLVSSAVEGRDTDAARRDHDAAGEVSPLLHGPAGRQSEIPDLRAEAGGEKGAPE